MGNNLITDSGDVDVYFTKYKSYVALISQEGSEEPTAIILNGDDSNFISDVTLTRVAEGEYRINSASDAFAIGKTFITCTINWRSCNCNYVIPATVPSPNYITLYSFSDMATTQIDIGGEGVFIKIDVYQ